MPGVSVTDSSSWFEWNDVILKRKAHATESDNAQDYADRKVARAIIKGRRDWSNEEVMKKANASRFDYDNYDDRDVARAINKRDRNYASKEAHEKAETAMAKLSINGPSKLPNDRGTAFDDAMYHDDLKRGIEPPKRKPSGPLVARQPPSGSGSKSRADTVGVQGREGRGGAREKGKRNRSASASRTRDSLKKPATASSSNPTGGSESEPKINYPYAKNKEGLWICKEKGCESKSYTARGKYRMHYDTRHAGSVELYSCPLGADCTKAQFDCKYSYLKHLKTKMHEEAQARHDEKTNRTN